MLLKKKGTKRQSFSVESLAISSHEEQERDTDSPYLCYLEQRKSSAAIDYNSNNVPQQWNYSARENGLLVNDFGPSVPENVLRNSFERHPTPFSSSTRLPSHSTPIMPSPKRRRLDSTCTPPSSDESSADDRMLIDNSSVLADEDKQSPASTSTTSASDADNESTCSEEMSRGRKKARTAFNGEQLKELEKRYKSQKYLTASDRTNIARSLKLREQQVKTWFQNRRMKEKRQQREEEQSRGFCLPTGGVDVSQLAAFGICPPPYQLSSPSPNSQAYSRLPSPIDMRISSVPQAPSPNGNTVRQHQLLPNTPYSTGMDHGMLQKLHATGDLQNVLRNENSYDKLTSFVSTQGLHVPMALYPGRHSLPNTGLSPNPASYHYVNHAR
ncbi:homeobox protein vex1-like [Mercenaria mercenaria]|uniref:homeobox protein vex1-like n=1 Tax=Mercenaria mercenaria TaxID=6596 RepID=UPI00234F87BD|nr:homeobox protein vex1-like [Mercenaria mercenaria]